eukprot:1389040-Amorphochlora_amoeboformis.AAC.1
MLVCYVGRVGRVVCIGREFGSGDSGLGIRVWGFGSGDLGLGIRFWGFGSEDSGLEFGFGVSGLGDTSLGFCSIRGLGVS